MATISQIVAQVVEQLSESISELMLLVISWQEQNAAPPDSLPERVNGASQSAMIVRNVAQELARTEYAMYPDIMQRIVDAAATVEQANGTLTGALSALMGGTERQAGWDGLVSAIKDISGETIKLLQIVYGAEREKIFRAAEEALEALTKVNPDEAATVPKDFVAAVNDAATKAAQLGQLLIRRAEDADSPEQKQQLISMGKGLRAGADQLIKDVNQLLRDPENPDLRSKVLTDLSSLNSKIDEATLLLNELNHEFDDAFDRFDDASRSMERSLAELERAKLATYADDILVTAAKEKEGMKFLAEDLEDGDADAARSQLEQVKGYQERLVKLADLELGCLKDASKKRELQQIRDELQQGFPSYEQAAQRCVQNPADSSARTALDRQRQQMEQRIEALERFVENPGARLRAIARKEKEDAVKLQHGAEDQDPKVVSRAAKAVVTENKDLIALARRQAGNTEDPIRRKQIMDGCDELERLLPHNIMAAKAVMENPDDASARAILDKRTRGLQAQIDALVENACPHPELELIAAVNLERKMATTMNEGGLRGDRATVDQTAPRLANNTRRIDELAKQIVNKFEDRARKARLIDALAKLDRATNQYAKDTQALAGNSSNPTLKGKAEKGQAEINRLLDVVLLETEAELFAESLRQKTDLHALENAMNEGDTRSMAQTAQTVAKRQANLCALARASARRTEDPLKRKQMLDDIDELEMFMPDAIKAASKALENPEDAEAQRRLAESVRMMDSLLGGMMTGESAGDGERRGKRSGQEEMGDGLLELQALMPEMVALAEKTAQDPSAQNLRAMEELLARLDLEALDGDEGRLAVLMREHNDALAELCDAAERGDKAGTQAAQVRLQAAHQAMVQHARSIASRTEDDLKRKRMMECCDELDMLFPMVKKAAGDVADDHTNSAKREELRDLVRRVHHNTDALAHAGCNTPEIVLSESAKREQDALKRLQKACQAGDVAGRNTAYKDVEAANKTLVEAARQCARGIADPTIHKRLMENITELERLMPNLNASTDKAARNKGNAQMQKKAAEDIVQASQLINRIVADTRACPIAVCQQEDMILQTLAMHITGVSTEAANDIQQFKAKHLEMKQVVTAEMGKMTNAKRKQAIAAAIERMDRFIPSHVQSAMGVLQAPGNHQAREQFNTTNQHLRASLASIIAALRPSLANVVNNDRHQGLLLCAQLRDTARRGDQPNTEKVLSALGPVSERLVKTARDFAQKGGAPRDRERLEQSASKLQQLQSTVGQLAREAAANPGNAAKQAELAAHTRKMEDCMNMIADTIGTPSNATKDEARRRLNALLASTRSGRIDSQRFLGAAKGLAAYINKLGGAGGDMASQLAAMSKYANAPAVKRAAASGDIDELLSFLANIGSDEAFQPKTWDEMIQKVANDVKKAAGNDSSDPIMKATRMVGLELAKIAKAAKEGDRTGMVKAGRDAARAINALIAILKPMAERCRDPRTKAQMLRTIQAMKNYSTQLQILCAVKAGAAIGDQDADTQGQLVSMAKLLGRCLTDSVNTVKTMRNARFI